MPNALTAIFGADASQAINETKRLGSAIDSVAKGGVKSRLFGGHGVEQTGPGGGMSGIVRESGVLIREASRGNWNRMLGSLSLMAQYTGVLSKVIKSSAAESVAHAAALNKEAIAAANAALSEKILQGVSEKQIALQEARIAYLIASRQQNVLTAAQNGAVTISNTTEAQIEIALNEAKIKSSQTYAAQKLLEAEVATEVAEIEASNATVSLGPIAWTIAALVALGVAIFSVAKFWKALAMEKENLNRIMLSNATFSEQTAAMDKAAESAKEFAKWLDNLGAKEITAKDKSDEMTEAIKRRSAAQLELNGAQNEAAQEAINLAEKTGQLSKQDAIKAHADLEIKALKDKSAAETKAISDELEQRNSDLAAAKIAEADAKKTAEEAALKVTGGEMSDESIKKIQYYQELNSRLNDPTVPGYLKSKTNTELARNDLSPQEKAASDAMERQSKMEQLKKDEGKLNSWAETLQGNINSSQNNLFLPKKDVATKQQVDVGGEKMPWENLSTVKKLAHEKQMERLAFERSLSPDEANAAKTRTLASQASSSRLGLEKDTNKLGVDLAEKKKNDPAIIAAKEQKINTKEQGDLLGSLQFKGFGLNNLQKMGGYAATPPEMKVQVELLRSILNKLPTPPAGNPVGGNPVGFGGRK